MNECSQCIEWEQKLTQLEERLKARLGLRINIPMLRDLGLRIELVKPVKKCACGVQHYAKGMCYTHYMKAKRQSDTRNELGQHIGRKGKILCDFEGCDYDMKRRVKAIDGKWYCASHHKGEIMGDTGIEA